MKIEFIPSSPSGGGTPKVLPIGLGTLAPRYRDETLKDKNDLQVSMHYVCTMYHIRYTQQI